MCRSAERMGMPAIPEYFFSEVLPQLVKLDEAWVPAIEGCSLYIRPVMFATDEKEGEHATETYRFVVFTTPVAAYYSQPLKTLAQKQYIRAAQGGIGGTKAAGNYGGAMQPSTQAKARGYDQIIWLDAKEFKYIEEAGTMNIMVVLNDTLITPPVGGTTLNRLVLRANHSSISPPLGNGRGRAPGKHYGSSRCHKTGKTAGSIWRGYSCYCF